MLEIQLHLDSHLVATSGRSVILLTAHNHASQSLGYFDADIGYLALSSDALLDASHEGDDDYLSKLCYLRPTLQSLDFDRIKGWIQHCENTHEGCSANRQVGFPGLAVFRLIDVVSNALVELSEGEPPPHLAFSYVWGSVPSFRLTTVNRSRLMSPRGIENAWNLLSATIKDAISLTRMLEVRYIWIDSLSLVQNDDLDLEQGVRVMDCIFEQSKLTIVGACGHDANAGLVGLHNSDREEEGLVVEVSPGLFMGAYSDLDSFLTKSVQESRAWT